MTRSSGEEIAPFGISQEIPPLVATSHCSDCADVCTCQVVCGAFGGAAARRTEDDLNARGCMPVPRGSSMKMKDDEASGLSLSQDWKKDCVFS